MPPLTQEQTNTINEASKNATIGAENLINSPGRPSLPTSQANLFDLTQYLTPKQSQTDTKVQDLQTKSNTAFDELFGAMGATENRGAQTTAIEAQYGVPQLTLDLTQIDNEITQKALEFRREQEAIQKSTGSVAQKNAQLADVSRKQYSQMADMEVVRAAKAKTLDAINSIISKKIDRQFADEDARINNLKFQYETIKSDLTKTEDRQYNEMITREERAFNIAKSKYEQVETAKGELIKNATLNGAGTATLKKIMAAQTLEDAYASAGSFGLSIDDKIKRAQLDKIRAELAPEVSDKASGSIDTITQIDGLLTNKAGLRAAVGPNWFTRGGAAPGEKKKFLAETGQLIWTLTLNTFQEAKAKGVTFGAASEAEWKGLQAAASALKGYAEFDNAGNIKRFKTTEKNVETELQKLQTQAKQNFKNATGYDYPEVDVQIDENGNVVTNNDNTDEGFWNNEQ